MTPIWLLSTRGRPKACQEVLNACFTTGMGSPGVVYVDDDRKGYEKLTVPWNWQVHYGDTDGGLAASMQWCLTEFPAASQYGWLADDTVPRTVAWDRHLERAAGDWCVSYARDLWLSENQNDEQTLIGGWNYSSGVCWGGKLVREAGWWALPNVKQAGIDTAWAALTNGLGLSRYLPDVIVEHKNWRTGKRERDQTDDWVRDGDEYVRRDIRTSAQWQGSDEFRALMKRVRVLAGAA